jgi:hypothetical protein
VIRWVNLTGGAAAQHWQAVGTLSGPPAVLPCSTLGRHGSTVPCIFCVPGYPASSGSMALWPWRSGQALGHAVRQPQLLLACRAPCCDFEALRWHFIHRNCIRPSACAFASDMGQQGGGHAQWRLSEGQAWRLGGQLGGRAHPVTHSCAICNGGGCVKKRVSCWASNAGALAVFFPTAAAPSPELHKRPISEPSPEHFHGGRKTRKLRQERERRWRAWCSSLRDVGGEKAGW